MHPQTQVPPLAANRFVYYGSWDDPKKYELWLPAKNIAGYQVLNKLPWTLEALDQAALDMYLDGDVFYHRTLDGWTLLALIGFRDSVYHGHYFLADGEHSRESMTLAVRERFPEVVGLYCLESLLCSPPARK